MKLLKPDTESTEQWESKSFEFKGEFRTNLTLRELNTAMSLSDEPAFDQNRYLISVLWVSSITELVDEKGKKLDIARDTHQTQGVNLITTEFLEMLPPALFMEMADFCMSKALTKLTDDSAKN